MENASERVAGVGRTFDQAERAERAQELEQAREAQVRRGRRSLEDGT